MDGVALQQDSGQLNHSLNHPPSNQQAEIAAGVDQNAGLVMAHSGHSKQTVGILVAGMHRSGTSASTRILSLLGADLPANLMPAHEEFNASGFWESNDVVALNEELLAAGNSSWDDVLPFANERLDAVFLSEWQSKLKSLLENNFANSNWFVIKDPRMAKLLPCWLPVIQKCAQVKVIVPVRAPSEVAASLAKREGFAPLKSTYLWLRHMLDAIIFSQGLPRAIIVYDELLQDWRGSVERLRQELDVVWPAQVEAVAQEIDAFIKPDLRHYKRTDQPVASSDAVDAANYLGSFGPMASRLYQALSVRAPNLNAIALEIGQQLQMLERDFAPLMQDYLRQRELIQSNMQEQERAWHLRYQHLQREFEEKCAHVQHQENILEKERALFKNLQQEFQTKCNHVTSLLADVANLRGHIERLKAQVAEMSASSAAAAAPASVNASVENDPRWQELLDKLQLSEALTAQQQQQISEHGQQTEKMQQQQRQCREEISRADAQLELLKDLLLHD